MHWPVSNVPSPVLLNIVFPLSGERKPNNYHMLTLSKYLLTSFICRNSVRKRCVVHIDMKY